MLKKTLLFAIVLAIFGLGIWGIQPLKENLSLNAPWLLILAAALGIILGASSGLATAKYRAAGDTKERHSIDSFLEHWGTAAGLFVMMFSGFRIVSGGGDVFLSNLHFLGLFFTLIFGCYFATDFLISRKYRSLLPSGEDIVRGTVGKYFFRLEWHEQGKYLSSQKSAFLTFAILFSEIAVTGVVKLAAFSWNIPFQIIKITTLIHDAASGLFVLMLVIHVLLVITIRSHRRLLFSWFTGNPVEISPETAPIATAVKESNLEVKDFSKHALTE